MLKLDLSRMPPEMAGVLLLRGAELPPVSWSDRPNRAGRTQLSAVRTEEDLLKCKVLVDAGMAGAVRALLYLWHGWLEECERSAQAVPARERSYLTALRARHAGQTTEAKLALAEVTGHDIHPELLTYALEVIGLGVDPILKRFKDTLTMASEWEPFLFVDLCEQGRLGSLCNATEQIVRRLQAMEFELLLAHCYAAATGRRLAERSEERVEPRPRRREPTRPKTPPAPAPKAETPAKPAAAAPPPPPKPRLPADRIGVQCPKCAEANIVPAAARGRPHTCVKCAAAFLIPAKKATAKK